MSITRKRGFPVCLGKNRCRETAEKLSSRVSEGSVVLEAEKNDLEIMLHIKENIMKKEEEKRERGRGRT